MVRDWEERYGFHIKQLEERVSEESKGDFTGTLWLRQPLVEDGLSVPGIAWNSAINPLFSSVEETVYQLSGSHEPSAENFNVSTMGCFCMGRLHYAVYQFLVKCSEHWKMNVLESNVRCSCVPC
jgi:hypothetical protein